ncbi:c-type cytochrome [Flavobacterium agricola]|uniref:c-type cytochrome n=1 Tax=Flavobacterium agricola TaxID=2870839 RepID=UPI00222148CE|nr:c-type cytochrome [Flavobacterium agricola]
MQKSDCFACHKTDSKLLGPSYQEIANKYTAADTDMMVTHIIDGSTGVWGDLQMTPHPGLSTADAKAMVDYILTLKTN